MAHLVINKATVTKSNLPVPAGAIIGFNSHFLYGKTIVAYDMLIYASKADYLADKNQILLEEIPSNGYVKDCSGAEFATLETEAGAITKITTWLKNYLVSTGEFVNADLTVVIPD